MDTRTDDTSPVSSWAVNPADRAAVPPTAAGGRPGALPPAEPGHPTPDLAPDGAQTPPGPPDDDDLDLIEGDYRAARPSRVRVLMLAGIVAALAFSAGALVQKDHDRSGTGAGATAGARGGPSAGGFPGEGFAPGGAGGSGGPGQGGASGSGARSASGSAAGSAATAGSAAGSAATAGAAATSTPVVVGTVVSVQGTTLRVRNFAGTVVVVTVPAGTPVTVPGLGGTLAAGSTVSVTGTQAADGSVTASAVTSRAGS